MAPRRAGPLTLAALAVAIGTVAASPPAVVPDRPQSTSGRELRPGAAPAELEDARRELLALVNEERSRAGLGALERDAALERAASHHAADMMDRGYFGHESPEGSTAWTRTADAGYRRALVLGEAIASGQRTAAEVVAAWLASPPHRRILFEKRATESGVGVAVGEHGQGTKILWVELVAASAPER